MTSLDFTSEDSEDSNEEMMEEDDTGGGPSRKNQLNVHPLTWCTPEILKSLGGRSPIATMIQMLAEYMSLSLGMKKPHEQTYKWWLALLIMMHYQSVYPRYQLIYEHLQCQEQDKVNYVVSEDEKGLWL